MPLSLSLTLYIRLTATGKSFFIHKINKYKTIMKEKSKIKLKKVRNGYILYKINGNGAHSHFFNRRAARKCQRYK